MCLGIPGKVVRWIDRDPLFARAEIEFAAVRRICQMACVPDVAEGEYVIIHAGIAIARIDEQEVERFLKELQSAGSDNEWDGAEDRDEISG